MFVIRRTDQGGGYLSASASGGYTHDVAKARTFRTEEEADKERCKGNEVAVRVDSILQKPE